jgi:hypothetical protein
MQNNKTIYGFIPLRLVIASMKEQSPAKSL